MSLAQLFHFTAIYLIKDIQTCVLTLLPSRLEAVILDEAQADSIVRLLVYSCEVDTHCTDNDDRLGSLSSMVEDDVVQHAKQLRRYEAFRWVAQRGGEIAADIMTAAPGTGVPHFSF